MVRFLGLNRHAFDDAEVVAEIFALADTKVGEEELADWIRLYVTNNSESQAA
jgi:hypothetical protein